MIMFFICSFIAAGVGFCFVMARRSRLQNAVRYTATLIGVQESVRKRGSMLYKVVKPCVKYNNGKRDIVADYHDYIRKTDFHYLNGAEIEIRAYPELPKIFYLAENDDHISYEAVVCFVTAAVFLIVGVLSIITFG